jgi:hypothetical protein
LKNFKVLVAALAAVAIATPAMAVTADVSGNLWVRGLWADGLAQTAGKAEETKGFDQRLRLFTTAAANENVKMVFGVEVDGIWGRTNQAAGAAKELGSVGADVTGAIEVKHLYLDFKVPTIGANVKAGVQGFALGRGMIINDDASGLQFSMPVAGNNLSLLYIRPQTGTHIRSSDNSNFWAAKYDLKVSDVKVAPYAAYYKLGSRIADAEVIYLGLDVDGKAGNFGYAFTAIVNDWEAGSGAAKEDGNGIALFGKVSTKVDTIALSLEAGYMGDKDAGGDFVGLSQNGMTGATGEIPTGPIVNISEITTGGRFAANTTLNANINGGNNLYRTNWLFAKLSADLQLTKASKLSAAIAHIAEAEDRGPGADARTYGQEVNVYYDYAIVPNLDLTLMGAYLFADDDLETIVGHDDNIWKAATQLAYRF